VSITGDSADTLSGVDLIQMQRDISYSAEMLSRKILFLNWKVTTF